MLLSLTSYWCLVRSGQSLSLWMRLCTWIELLLVVMLATVGNSVRLLRVLGKLRQTPLRPVSTPPPVASGPPAMTNTAIQKTGGFFQQLPEIYPSDFYFKKALKQARTIKIDSSIKNVRNANRKHAAQVMDGLMKALTVPITNVLNIYKKDIKRLHPYEATVTDLTIVARAKAGHPHLQHILEDLRELRVATSRIAKGYAVRAKTAASAIEARDCMVEGIRELEGLYNSSDKAQALREIGELQKTLRRIPVIELSTPTVVLVGSPNVGKSTIVRAVSTGTPEVNDYPFTTRGVTVGHIVDREAGTRYQVMDTPGLLDRPEEARNEMERLTFASMLHLPTAVLFVIDPTGLSGDQSSLQAQLNVRAYLKARFPRRPWLDVVSKADLALRPEVQALLPQGHLRVSVHDGTNMNVLRQRLDGMFGTLQGVMMAMQGSPGGAGEVQEAQEVQQHGQEESCTS